MYTHVFKTDDAQGASNKSLAVDAANSGFGKRRKLVATAVSHSPPNREASGSFYSEYLACLKITPGVYLDLPSLSSTPSKPVRDLVLPPRRSRPRAKTRRHPTKSQLVSGYLYVRRPKGTHFGASSKRSFCFESLAPAPKRRRVSLFPAPKHRDMVVASKESVVAANHFSTVCRTCPKDILNRPETKYTTEEKRRHRRTRKRIHKHLCRHRRQRRRRTTTKPSETLQFKAIDRTITVIEEGNESGSFYSEYLARLEVTPGIYLNLQSLSSIPSKNVRDLVLPPRRSRPRAKTRHRPATKSQVVAGYLYVRRQKGTHYGASVKRTFCFESRAPAPKRRRVNYIPSPSASTLDDEAGPLLLDDFDDYAGDEFEENLPLSPSLSISSTQTPPQESSSSDNDDGGAAASDDNDEDSVELGSKWVQVKVKLLRRPASVRRFVRRSCRLMGKTRVVYGP